jgi:hypothetical protein
MQDTRHVEQPSGLSGQPHPRNASEQCVEIRHYNILPNYKQDITHICGKAELMSGHETVSRNCLYNNIRYLHKLEI